MIRAFQKREKKKPALRVNGLVIEKGELLIEGETNVCLTKKEKPGPTVVKKLLDENYYSSGKKKKGAQAFPIDISAVCSQIGRCIQGTF